MTRPTWDQTFMRNAEVIAERSVCCRRQVGCVIVTKDNRMCAEGYNGPPPDYQREATCECGHFEARHGKKVYACSGCSCVQFKRTTGVTCATFCERGAGVPAEYGTGCPSAHAEMNAIAFANWTDTSGGTIYITTFPCPTCCLLIASARINRVVCKVAAEHSDRDPDKSFDILRRCGIRVDKV